jgi:hypothetical protein
VAGQNYKKVTRSAPHCRCVMGKFSNFQIFAADSKMFENFPTDSNFFEKISSQFKKIDGKLTHGAPFSVPVAHLVVRYG